MAVKGRDMVYGLPKTIILEDDEIRSALTDSVNAIVAAIRVALDQTPPELSGDIIERGIILTGGGSLLKNLDERIRFETGMPVLVASEPLASVVIGTGKMLARLQAAPQDVSELTICHNFRHPSSFLITGRCLPVLNRRHGHQSLLPHKLANRLLPLRHRRPRRRLVLARSPPHLAAAHLRGRCFRTQLRWFCLCSPTNSPPPARPFFCSLPRPCICSCSRRLC